MTAAMVLAASALGGCGGGGGAIDTGGFGAPVPASATASPEAYSHYVGSLPPDEQAEPKPLDRVEPPTSETAEPIEVS